LVQVFLHEDQIVPLIKFAPNHSIDSICNCALIGAKKEMSMKYNKLGKTGIEVSELCLGTMTWGTQNTQEDAFYQADTAFAAGVNFMDTAEMYPVNPLSAGTQGDSERVLGNWLAQSGKRDRVVVATKVAGNGVKIYPRRRGNFARVNYGGGRGIADISENGLH
jgi:aryl-alcohol dehydrogenase-like predicted oxidoreductase